MTTATPPAAAPPTTTAVIPFTEEDLHELYTWVDEIPLSRPKRNIARDFADGCCVAEMVKYFFPKLVELHNYSPSMSRAKKLDNWHTLNARVFRKLYFEVPEDEIEDIIGAVPGAIERFLRALRVKIAQIKERRAELSALYRLEDGEQRRLGGGGGSGGEAAAPYDHEDVSALIGERAAAAAAATGTSTPRATSATRRQGNGVAHTNNIVPGSNTHRAIGSAQTIKEGNRLRATATTTSAAPAMQTRPPVHPYDEPHMSSPEEVGESVQQLLNEKDRTIMELRETVGILSEKIMKLEELVRVKDDKLSQYRSKFGRV